MCYLSAVVKLKDNGTVAAFLQYTHAHRFILKVFMGITVSSVNVW